MTNSPKLKILFLQLTSIGNISSQLIANINSCCKKYESLVIDVLSFNENFTFIDKAIPVDNLIVINNEDWSSQTIDAIHHYVDAAKLVSNRHYDLVINLENTFQSCLISRILYESGIALEGYCFDDAIEDLLLKFDESKDPSNYYDLPPTSYNQNNIIDLQEKIYSNDDLQQIESELIHLFLNQQYLALEEKISSVIGRNPNWLNGWKILSDTYLIQGKDAKFPAQKALALNQNDANEHCYYGLILKSEGDLFGAARAFTEAIRLNPNYAAAHNNLGIIKKDLGDVSTGIHHFQKALRITPSYSDCFSNLLLCLSHYDQIGANALHKAHVEFSQLYEVPIQKKWGVHDNSNHSDRILNIGFVSADFRDHSVSYCFEPLLNNLQHSQSLKLFAYYNHSIEDETTNRLKVKFSKWCEINELSDVDLCQQVKHDRIDILVDLSGHTAGNRLTAFAMKPAPIQVSWFGYLATTGLKAIDYYLADGYLAPPNQFDAYFSEKLVQLPVNAPFMPVKNAPTVNALPALINNYLTFACFNRESKISDAAILQWSMLLKALPNAKLLLGAISQTECIERLKQRFIEHGVNCTQLVFKLRSNMQAYLALHHEVDICLDTQPSSGVTTTFHAAWMGVPTLCLDGKTLTGRGSMAIMSHLVLPQFIAHNCDDFVQLGCYWSTHLNELALIRSQMRQRFMESPIANTAMQSNSLELSFRKMWRTWCKRQIKKTFSISS